jgi:HSP20 family protein
VTVRRFDPLRDLLVLQERMNRLFEDSLTRTRADPPAALRPATWIPAADAYETADMVVVELELAGVTDDDVDLAVDGSVLTVRGRRRPAQARPDSYHRMERSYGAFARTIDLACAVDPERVHGTLKDGVLRVEVRKRHARPSGRTLA